VGEWERDRFVGVEVVGKILGVIGLAGLAPWWPRRPRAWGWSSWPMIPCVQGARPGKFVTANEVRGCRGHGRMTVMKSTREGNSRAPGALPPCSAALPGHKGIIGQDDHPQALAFLATRAPTRPRPMTPSISQQPPRRRSGRAPTRHASSHHPLARCYAPGVTAWRSCALRLCWCCPPACCMTTTPLSSPSPRRYCHADAGAAMTRSGWHWPGSQQ